MKKTGWIVAVIVLGLAAGGLTIWLNRATAPKPTLSIGAALALTGPLAGQGQLEVAAINQAFNNLNRHGGVNGKQVVLVTRDTQSTDSGTTTAINQLANAYSVPLIIGPTDTINSVAADRAAASHGIPLISPSTALDTLATPTTDLFSLWPSQAQQADFLEQFAHAKHVSRVGILTGTDAPSQQFGRTLASQLKTGGITDITTVTASPDFAAIATALKAHSPQMIFILISNGDEFGPLLVNLKTRLPDALLVGNAPLQNQTLIANYGNQLNGLIYAYPHRQGTTCTAAVKQAAVIQPGNLTSDLEFVPAYDAGLAAAALLKEGATTPRAVSARIATLSTDGLCGESISFDKKHQLKSLPFELRTFKTGQYVLYR